MMMEQNVYPEKQVVFNVQRMSVISCSKLLVSALESDLTHPRLIPSFRAGAGCSA